MKVFGIVLAVSLYVGLSIGADAAPITYHEAIDGQLSPSDPLTMGVGTNVVTGTGCWGIPLVGCNTLMNFSFEIPENMQLTGYRYILGDVDALYWHFFPNWLGQIAIINMDELEIRFSGVADWLFGEDQTLAIDFLTPMGAGSYHQFIMGSRTGVFGSWDYRIELDVVSTLAEIPLPATVLFFGLGLGLVGLSRRYKSEMKA